MHWGVVQKTAKLYKSYLSAKERYNRVYGGIGISEVDKIYEKYYRDLAKLPFIKVAIEIIAKDMLKFSLEFSEKKTFILRVGGDTSYSFFIDGILVNADFMNWETDLPKFEKYLKDGKES
jgi:hypothetical protein